MPFRTISETGEQYALLSFDKDGKERDNDPDGQAGLFSARLLNETKQHLPSDIFVFSHGWKGDITAAEDQYNRWIKAMLDLPVDRAAMGEKFKPLWIGLHWPSLPFGDEELAADSFDATGGGLSPTAVVETYLERLGLGEEARPLLETIVEANRRNAAALSLPPEAATAYQELAVLAGRKAGGPFSPPDEDGAPFDPDKAFDAGNAASIGTDFGGAGGFLGGILGPLRQLSYWTMKKRARSIGESGMHLFIAQLMNAAPVAKIHLMGHSFGCIVIASILGGPGAKEPLPRPVDSVALVQGAVSLWAFADTI
ncbi:MAG TPA: hypothetical protein VK638_32335, partial [Edaphobacter sp.]|nr:hypothetical protein [Edaphobacter sp.]